MVGLSLLESRNKMRISCSLSTGTLTAARVEIAELTETPAMAVKGETVVLVALGKSS